MSSFGTTLKKQREAKGIPLQEISDRTKIGVRLLKAIEDEQLDQLPGGIFDKSFLRQYARYLGIDEEQVIAEYVQAVGETPESQTAATSPPVEERAFLPTTGYPRLILTAISLGIAVAAILYGVHQFTQRRSPPSSPATPATELAGTLREAPSGFSGSPSLNLPEVNPAPAPTQISTPALPSPSGQGTLPSSSPGAKPLQPGNAATVTAPVLQSPAPSASAVANAAAPGGLVLQIDAQREVWLSISADGQIQWQGTLLGAGVRKVEARESVRLTVGDAGAVALTLNGKVLPSVGRSGEVKTLTISAKGLAPSPTP